MPKLTSEQAETLMTIAMTLPIFTSLVGAKAGINGAEPDTSDEPDKQYCAESASENTPGAQCINCVKANASPDENDEFKRLTILELAMRFATDTRVPPSADTLMLLATRMHHFMNYGTDVTPGPNAKISTPGARTSTHPPDKSSVIGGTLGK